MMETVLHASAVAQHGRGLLFLGASGSGKSACALQAIALGAELISDDRTRVSRQGGKVLASPAPNIAGQIEARHIGLLTLPYISMIPIEIVVDLDQLETERLPSLRHINVLDVDLPLYRRVDGPHFVSTLLLCLAGSRSVP